MTFHPKHFPNIAIAIFTLAVVSFLVFVAMQPHSAMNFDNEELITLNEGWTLVSSESDPKAVSLPTHLTGFDGTAVLSKTLPDNLPTPAVLCLRSSLQTLYVTVDGNTIYTYGEKDAFGKAPASAWHLVRLPQDAAGKTVRLTLSSPYKGYSGVANEILLGSRSAVLFHIFQTQLPSFLISVGIFLIGLCLILGAIVFCRHRRMIGGLFQLGLFSVLIATWLFGETKMIQFFSDNVMFMFYVTFVAMMTFPIPLLQYIRRIPDFHYGQQIQYGIYALCTGILVILGIQSTGIADFMDIIVFIHMVVFSAAIFAIVFLLLDIYKHKNNHTRAVASPFIVLCIAGLFEIIQFYVSGGVVVGNYLRIGVLIFVILQGILAIRRTGQILRSSREAQRYRNLAIKDGLTGCYNRRAYQRDLMCISKGDPMTVVMADLNNLKWINDQFGHEMGDDALIQCSSCFKRTFSPYGKCYRIGGDEFVFLSDHASAETAEQLMATFEGRCEEQSNFLTYPFSVATGFAVHDAVIDEFPADAVTRADEAMYRKKSTMKHL